MASPLSLVWSESCIQKVIADDDGGNLFLLSVAIFVVIDGSVDFLVGYDDRVTLVEAVIDCFPLDDELAVLTPEDRGVFLGHLGAFNPDAIAEGDTGLEAEVEIGVNDF